MLALGVCLSFARVEQDAMVETRRLLAELMDGKHGARVVQLAYDQLHVLAELGPRCLEPF